MESTHETEQTSTNTQTEPGAEVTASPASLPMVTAWYKNTKVLVAVAIAVILLGGAGFYAYTMNTTGGTVAVVNGKKIYQNELNESIALIEQTATSQGADITDPTVIAEIRSQALDVLVNNTLIMTAADDAGFSASDEEIGAKYDELVTQLGGAEQLATRMGEIGLTEKKLKQNIAERIVADKYIESVTTIKDLKVSDIEVAEFIKTLGDDSNLPPLEEIRPQIEAEILSQKQQQLVVDLLKKLQDEGTVELK